MAHEHIDWKWPVSKIIEDAPELLGYDKADLIDWLHNAAFEYAEDKGTVRIIQDIIEDRESCYSKKLMDMSHIQLLDVAARMLSALEGDSPESQ